MQDSSSNQPWNSESYNQIISVNVPPEFNGAGGALSPEDLFSHSLMNCFLATFKVYAQASKLNFKSVKAQGLLTVDKEGPQPVMKHFELNVTIESPDNKDKAELLANKAFKSGFILNSVKTDLKFNLNFE